MTMIARFPVSGQDVNEWLANSPAHDLWTLGDIETLSDGDSLELGALWQRVRAGPITISTADLKRALTKASQVIYLSFSNVEDPNRSLLIEDGRLESNSISS